MMKMTFDSMTTSSDRFVFDGTETFVSVLNITARDFWDARHELHDRMATSMEVYSMMTAEEQKAFFFQIIDNFLCTAMADVSQKEILDAIHCLGASHFDLIDYMHNYLGIGSTKPKLTTSPIAMMYSVIHLSLRQLSQIKMPTMP